MLGLGSWWQRWFPNEDQPPKALPARARGTETGTREQWEKIPHWTPRDGNPPFTARLGLSGVKISSDFGGWGGGINNLSMVKGTQGLRGGQTSQEVEVPILVPPQISG